MALQDTIHRRVRFVVGQSLARGHLKRSDSAASSQDWVDRHDSLETLIAACTQAWTTFLASEQYEAAQLLGSMFIPYAAEIFTCLLLTLVRFEENTGFHIGKFEIFAHDSASWFSGADGKRSTADLCAGQPHLRRCGTQWPVTVRLDLYPSRLQTTPNFFFCRA